MTTLYAVRNWDAYYEVAQSRKIRGPLPWVALPTKHDGKGYRRIVALDNCAELLGCWMLIVQIAAKCQRRGLLADDDGPLTAEDLAFKTGVPAASFTRALEVFARPSVNWLCIQSGSTIDHAPDTGQDRTGPDRTEPDITEPDSDPDAMSGSFREVSVEMLRSEAMTDAWFQAGKRFGKLTSPHHRHQVHAMAAHALRIGKLPARVFVKNVKALDFSAITSVDADEATGRIARLDKPTPGVLKSVGIDVAPVLKEISRDPSETDRRQHLIRQAHGLVK